MTPAQKKAKIRNWNKFRLEGIIRTLGNMADESEGIEKHDLLFAQSKLLIVKKNWKRRTK